MQHLELGELADPFTQYFGLRPVQKWKLHIARTRRHHAMYATRSAGVCWVNHAVANTQGWLRARLWRHSMGGKMTPQQREEDPRRHPWISEPHPHTRGACNPMHLLRGVVVPPAPTTTDVRLWPRAEEDGTSHAVGWRPNRGEAQDLEELEDFQAPTGEDTVLAMRQHTNLIMSVPRWYVWAWRLLRARPCSSSKVKPRWRSCNGLPITRHPSKSSASCEGTWRSEYVRGHG